MVKPLLSMTRSALKRGASSAKGCIPEAFGSCGGRGVGKACGCVLDMRLAVGTDGIVEEAKYETKRVVMGPNGPIRTFRGGKVMMGPCNCSVVNALGNQAVSEAVGCHVEHLRNRMLFPTRAPQSFVRTVVSKLGLRQHQADCIRVFEAALYTTLTGREYEEEKKAVKLMQVAEEESDIDFRLQYAQKGEEGGESIHMDDVAAQRKGEYRYFV